MRDDRPNEGLWDFCLRLYAEPGVAPACLALQDEHGGNVPLLLCALWLGTRATELGDDDASALAEAIRAWNDDIVVPLRKVRTRLKAGPPPAPDVETERLRSQVKAAELDAELIEIGLLEQNTARLTADLSLNPTHTARENALRSIGAMRRTPPPPQARQLVEAILRAL